MKKKNTRERIISAAIHLFSDRGYDGTSVDAIADRVSINKATIYHHFKEKKEILDTIINRLIRDTVELRQRLVEEILKAGTNKMNQVKEIVLKQSDVRYDFIKKHKDIFTILLTEICKKKDKNRYLFTYIDTTLNLVIKDEAEQNLYKKLKAEKKIEAIIQKPEAFISSIFLGILPTLCFEVIKDKFADHYNVSVQESENMFRDMMLDLNEYLRKKLL